LRRFREAAGAIFRACGSSAGLPERFFRLAEVPQVCRSDFSRLRSFREAAGAIFLACGVSARLPERFGGLAGVPQASRGVTVLRLVVITLGLCARGSHHGDCDQ